MPGGQRAGIENQLKQLPKSYTTAEISAMYVGLRADVDRFRASGVPQALVEQRLHSKHKTLAFAYPALFFKVVKGEMSEYMFTKVMEIKQDLDQGKITQEQARDLVVDNAKRHVEGAAPRPARPSTNEPGTAVQEVVIRTQVDENSDMKVVETK